MAAHPLLVERQATVSLVAESGDGGRELALRLSPRRYVGLWAGVVGVLLITGSLQTSRLIDTVALLDPNGERNVPAAISALALLVAAGLTALVVRTSSAEHGRVAGWCLSTILAFMAFDEFGEIHERLERITGIDWQVLYLPLIAVAGVAALGTLVYLLPSARTRLLFLVGATCWVVSNLFEILEYDVHDHRVAGYAVMVLIEENLERIGSILFGLAMLVTLAATTRGPRASAVPFHPAEPVGSPTASRSAAAGPTTRHTRGRATHRVGHREGRLAGLDRTHVPDRERAAVEVALEGHQPVDQAGPGRRK